MNVMEQLNAVFCEVFGDKDLRIHPGATASDVDGWDSLSHVNLILAVESHFKIRFEQKELLRFRNVGDLAASIEKKLASAGASASAPKPKG